MVNDQLLIFKYQLSRMFLPNSWNRPFFISIYTALRRAGLVLRKPVMSGYYNKLSTV